jgi:enoyl-CoA hydratase/carnithine racemase
MNAASSIDLDRYQSYADDRTRFDELLPGVLRLTLCAPRRWNALHIAFHDALPRLFAEIAEDAQVRAFVLAAEGEVFSSGGDVGEGLRERHVGELVNVHRVATRIVTRLLEVPQPTVCIVNGPAIGFAASLALHCDFVIAASEASFRDSHTAFGVVPGDGLVLVMMNALGPALAREVLLAGRELSAGEAERYGLVNRVVPREQLEESAVELITRVLAQAPLAVRLGKMLINTRLRADAEGLLNLAMAAELVTMTSEDYRAAVKGFEADGRFKQDWQAR